VRWLNIRVRAGVSRNRGFGQFQNLNETQRNPAEPLDCFAVRRLGPLGWTSVPTVLVAKRYLKLGPVTNSFPTWESRLVHVFERCQSKRKVLRPGHSCLITGMYKICVGLFQVRWVCLRVCPPSLRLRRAWRRNSQVEAIFIRALKKI